MYVACEMTRTRRIAVLIDGGFFLKRLRKWPIDRKDPVAVAEALKRVCRKHVQRLCHLDAQDESGVWLDQVYRLFYYDAHPYAGTHHHPIENQQIDFSKTDEAIFRRALFSEVLRRRKFALRLGHVQKESDWARRNRQIKALLKILPHISHLERRVSGDTGADGEADAAALKALEAWKNLEAGDLEIPMRQKGVDMRIGLDIATMTLKRQVDTIVLVTGDSDFVPAAKLARREGVEIILDPLWQAVDDSLLEHVDGLASGLGRPEA